jgi:micrococcal nuclease
VKRLIAALLGAWFATAAIAQPAFEGTVTHVGDGDSIWLRRNSGGAPVAIRIEGIDAPEACQPHGTESREALARRVLHQRVHVRPVRHDDYGRLLARIEWQGGDVGAWLVRNGHAWSYRFRRDRGPYAKEERAAQRARRGLWSDAAAIEPRVFRRTHGPCP